MKYFLSLTLLTVVLTSFAQTTSQLEKITQLGKEWKFDEAISVINEELKSDSLNPELYYWLGRYSHFMVYDTRPFSLKSNEWSKDQVLSNFQKAIELSPDYGDAKYFIAAEYGARALEAIKRSDINQYKKEFVDAEKWGGFPLHAIEYGERILKSCDQNAILFVNGDAEFNILQYVQAIKGFRKDVSVVCIALIERPVNFTLSGEVSQQGLEDYLQKCGHTTRLVPTKVKGTPNEYDIEQFKSVMFNPTNYQHYSDIKENNQPRASFSFGQESRLRILTYANFCLDHGNIVEARHALKMLEELTPQEVHPYFGYIEEGVEGLKQEINF